MVPSDWKFLGESSSYSCVLVGTSFQSEDIRKGRIHILSIRSVGMEGNRRIEVRKRNQINCNEPVYSIAPFNERYVTKSDEVLISCRLILIL